MQHEPRAGAGVIQVHEQIPGLLHHPRLDRVPGDTENPDPAAAVLDHGQDVNLGAVQQVGGEEVQRQDHLRLGPQELRPPGAIPARGRIDARVLEDLPHRRRRHGHAQRGEFAVDTPVTPRLVLTRQPQHHRPDIAARRRTAGPASARHAHPTPAEDVTLPAQDRGRSHEQPHRGKAFDGQRPREQGQPGPVGPCQPGMRARLLALCDRELMAKDQYLGVLPPRLAPRQAQQRHDPGNNEEN
jgi:hypothetical protein